MKDLIFGEAGSQLGKEDRQNEEEDYGDEMYGEEDEDLYGNE